MKFTFNPKRHAVAYFERIREIRDAPHAVAGGVAMGMFWSFTPLTGLKTLLSIAFAWVFRYSKLSAALAVAFHDILSPLWPIVLRWEYQLGFWALSHPHRFPPKLALHKLNLEHLFRWNTLEVLWPTFLGSLLFAVPAAFISYWLVQTLLQQYETKHHRHLTPPS